MVTRKELAKAAADPPLAQGCYLLHFESPIDGYEPNEKFKDAQHYWGATSNIYKRIREHRKGGCKFTKAAKKQGVKFHLVYFVATNIPYKVENLLRPHIQTMCIICNPENPTESGGGLGPPLSAAQSGRPVPVSTPRSADAGGVAQQGLYTRWPRT